MTDEKLRFRIKVKDIEVEFTDEKINLKRIRKIIKGLERSQEISTKSTF